jgi:hypothetical protein
VSSIVEAIRASTSNADDRPQTNAPPSNSAIDAKHTSKSEHALPGRDGRSPLGEVLGTLTGSDGGSGMRIVLPAILLAALLAVLVLVLLRHRSAS